MEFNKLMYRQVTVSPDGRLDRKNAAVYLGISEKTLAQYATKGVGPRYVKPGRVFYFIDDLDNWLQSVAHVPSGSTSQRLA